MTHEQDANLEQLILETAEKLFLEKGFAMTSTTEIAKKVGCNQALVHYYFRTKENLFQSIFAKKIRLLLSSTIENSQKDISFEEKLKAKIESHFEMIRANPKLPFLVVNELITNPERINSLKEKINELPKSVFIQLQQELQIEIDNGRIRPIEIMDLVLTIVSLNAMLFLTGTIFKNIAQLTDTDFEKLIEHRKQEHVRIILASLKP
jgi:TetR/AcrR family transcriptional regulator